MADANDKILNSTAESSDEGLPAIAPDVIEEEGHEELIDNVVPTPAYQHLPMVGIGGSAGSIKALQTFFTNMPPETGMVFVVILHLSPEHESTMPEILQRSTQMRVYSAEDAMKVEPNCVYVIPPGKHLIAADGRLKLTELDRQGGKRVAVDVFFRTLADSHGPQSAAVVLSGADGDGAIGLKRIKERGGLTIAQDPEEAEHSSMPRSAIATGMVDWVLPVEEMPKRLLQYRENGERLRLPSEDGPQPAMPERPAPDETETALRDVLMFLRTRTGRDFSYYKRATIVRRVSRRMQVNGVDNVPAYLDFLRTHLGEAGALLQDLLISVTNFFRDRESFHELELRIPEIFRTKKAGEVVRVWVPACATGEEAYSIAMLLAEHASELGSAPNLQVFATDLDSEAIAVGREGVYPEAITADVSEERLRRFFVRNPRGFHVRQELREMVLFAVHDVLRDSPFSRLDLISCRNLLIYLNREAQKRALEIFHFALEPEARLFLGSSESVDECSPLFTTLDKKNRLYERKSVPRLPLPIPFVTGGTALRAQQNIKVGVAVVPGRNFAQAGPLSLAAIPGLPLPERPEMSWSELHFKLVERFSPPSLLLNADQEVVHLSENVGQYLHFTGGEPTANLLRIVHPMLRVDLRAALFRAVETSQSAEVFGVPVEIDGVNRLVNLRVAPAQEIAPGFLLVVFDAREAPESENGAARTPPPPVVEHLEREVEQVKAHLRDTVSQYEASTEELKASNEELQAMNEELRSATEELETSREELQSINEELSTVNQELKCKVDELAHSNSDMLNLMSATAIGTIFLDRRLRVMRYTPTAVEHFRLIPSDIGRPLNDLALRVNYAELNSDAEHVLTNLTPVKREVTDGRGRWYLAQMLPYRTTEDHIAGVVLTFVDITDTRAVAAALREAEERMRFAMEAADVYGWEHDPETLETHYAGNPERVLGFSLPSSVPEILAMVHPEDRAEAEEKFMSSLKEGGGFELEFRMLHPQTGKEVWQSGRGLTMTMRSGERRLVGITQNITTRRVALAAAQESERRFTALVTASSDAIYQMSADWSEMRHLRSGQFVAAVDVSTKDWMTRYLLPEEQAAVKAKIAEAVASKSVFELEHRVLRRDGSLGWMFSRAVPLLNASGEIYEWFGAATDVTARKDAEGALHASKAQLQTLVETAPLGVYLVADDFRILQVNPTALAFFGELPDLVGRDFGEVLHVIWPQEYADRVVDIFRHTLETGEPYFIPELVQKRHGREGAEYYEWQISRIPLPAGGYGVVCYFRDISAEVLAREQLARSRERLQQALEVETVGVLFLRPDGAITDANDAFLELIGGERSELEAGALRWDELTPPEWMPRTLEAMAELKESGRITAYEKQLCRKDGARWWGLFAGTSVGPDEGVEFVLDITQQKNTEAALAASQEHLRLVVENAREYAIFATDLDRRVVSWNSGAEGLLGYSETEIFGTPADIIFTEEDRVKRECDHESETALREGRAMDERWHVRKDGTRFWGSGAMMAMHNARGKVIGFVKILRDQTQIRAAQEELERSRAEVWEALQEMERARNEAEAANRTKDQFLAILSHELRTPLTPVIMVSETLLAYDDLPPLVQEGLQTICRNVQLEAHFIDDLLDITRITRGKFELTLNPLSLHDAVRSAIEISQPDIQQKEQHLDVKTNARDHWVVGDLPRLQQVFWNLLKNASKFTPKGGRLQLITYNEPGQIVIDVIDDGRGISPEALPTIFDPFRQGDENTARQFGGLGLGLAISKAAVAAHGGIISASSAGEGQGTILQVRLPLMNEPSLTQIDHESAEPERS